MAERSGGWQTAPALLEPGLSKEDMVLSKWCFRYLLYQICMK